MGSMTFYVDGLPVTVDDRVYSFDSNVRVVDPRAYKSTLDGSDVEELWRTQPSIRKVTGFLARNVAQVSLHTFERLADGDRQRVAPFDVPAATLAAHPDQRRRTTAFDLMHALVLDVCKHDRYLAQLFTDLDGSMQLVRLPPKTWRFERDATGQPLRAVARRQDGSEFTISLDRCLWLDGFPSDEQTSPIAALRGMLDEEELAASYRRDLWRYGGRLAGWISRPLEAPDWTKTGRETFRNGWGNYSAGGARAGRTPVLEDGMEYHEATGVTPEDGQQLESRKLTMSEVASAYHVAPVLVGMMDDANYSNVNAYRTLLYQDTLGSWFEQIAQAYNERLMPLVADPQRYFYEFNVYGKLKLAFEDQVRIFQSATGGPFMTRNEARRRVNLSRIEGADELIVPLNVIEGGQASPTDSGSQNQGGTSS